MHENMFIFLQGLIMIKYYAVVNAQKINIYLVIT